MFQRCGHDWQRSTAVAGKKDRSENGQDSDLLVRSIMNKKLIEEEMRLALFGSSKQTECQSVKKKIEPLVESHTQSPQKRGSSAKALSPKLRVTLNVTKEFEGDIEMLIFDVNTLSTLIAEKDAKKEAKRRKFKYFEVVSVVQI